MSNWTFLVLLLLPFVIPRHQSVLTQAGIAGASGVNGAPSGCWPKIPATKVLILSIPALPASLTLLLPFSLVTGCSTSSLNMTCSEFGGIIVGMGVFDFQYPFVHKSPLGFLQPPSSCCSCWARLRPLCSTLTGPCGRGGSQDLFLWWMTGRARRGARRVMAARDAAARMMAGWGQGNQKEGLERRRRRRQSHPRCCQRSSCGTSR